MDLTKATITKLNKDLLALKYSAVELAQNYLANIKANNSKYNIFLEITEEKALAAAKAVDAKLAKNENISKLAGIPTSFKDNYNWVDTHTTAASKILTDYISPYTATVAQRLLDDNAVVLGKTNMDAFAHGSSTETSDFGATKNPLDVTRVPGGSSGGAAAAVVAEMSTYAMGSETAGSVRGPAAWCGTYGFVPSFGMNSRFGIVAMGSSLDRPGVFANSVEDCAIVTDSTAGHDSQDATSVRLNRTEYTINLKAEFTKRTGDKFKLGLPREFLDDRIDAEVRAAVLKVAKEYEQLGAEIVEIDLLDPKYSMAVYTIICRSEVSSNLARIDGIRYGHYSEILAESVIDQIALNRGEGFGNEAKLRSMSGSYALSTGYYDAYYKKAQQVRTLIIEDFAQAFKQVDLIIGPTMPTVAPKIGVTANNPLFGELADILTEPSALAGLPCISMPIELDSAGLPIGMQIFGPQFSEQAILNLAYMFEQKLAK